jgi:hypothetical protein
MTARAYRALVKLFLPHAVRAAISRAVNRSPPTPPYHVTFAPAPPRLRPSPYSFMVDARHDVLSQLGAKYLPSKRNHNYLPYYWLHFRDVRHDVRHMLEIGLQTDHSIRMWEEFFPAAIIYGIDIDAECKHFAGGRRRIFIGDQSDPLFLRSVVDEIGAPLDIVIDDGSHLPAHQLATFEYLYPAMADHGIYVIEDTGGCVGDTGLHVINTLKTLVDRVNYWPTDYPGERWRYLAKLPDKAGWAAKHTIGVAFYAWMVVVMRGRNPEDNPFFLT